MKGQIKQIISGQSDLVLAISLIGILLILFTPIPPGFLDLFLIANFSFALLILLLTFYVDKPLQFSTFPSLLLIATLFRLALNISATRLILSDANAGKVIAAIGQHVVADNYIIGLIVFLVLIVVQYVVVTNGAQRVAEVAARFTLDSMPGKQMSIDADLSAGLIDDAEARSRRKQIEREGNFYGAMDGASKFVKGDAIAGIIIVLIDIIGGLAIGIAQKNMSWSDALHTYTLLTIGDGIVTQIPALIISVGTGLIVTRAGSDSFLSHEISRQIIAYPKTLLLISGGLLLVMALPGIPVFPVFIIFTVVALVTVYAYKRGDAGSGGSDKSAEQDSQAEDIYGLLTVEPVEISIGSNLIPLVGGEESLFMDRIVAFRKQYALEVGFVIPKVRVKDNKRLAPNSYEIFINGAKTGSGELLIDKLLAINPGNVSETLLGVETKDPSYGLPALWISETLRERAKGAGYTIVEPGTVLMTHLGEIFRQQSPNLLNRAETERLINRARESAAGLVEELIPNVLTVSEVQKIFQNLLRERVSIRNVDMILEVLVDYGKQNKDPGFLTELVRQKLSSVICQSLMGEEGSVYVLTLDPSIEQSMAGGLRSQEGRSGFVIDPKFSEQLIARLSDQVESMLNANLFPVLLCAPELRRHIRSFTERMLPNLSVLSMSEIPNGVQLKSYGMVTI